MIQTVRWPADERLHFLGRNGIAKCTGVEIFHSENVVELTPFTSRDLLGRCRICLPPAALVQVVKALSVGGGSGAGKDVSIFSTLEATLHDWDKPKRRSIPARIQASSDGVHVFCAGYGTAVATGGHGSLIALEVRQCRLRLRVWADMAHVAPTHVIDLEGARER